MRLPRLSELVPVGGDEAADGACACEGHFSDPVGLDAAEPDLVVDADACPGGGDLAASAACRATVVSALADRDAARVRTRADGLERTYDGAAAALLLAAGRFSEHVAFHDEGLAARARRDPLAAAREATGRAGPVATVVAETGLAAVADRSGGYDETLSPRVAPTIARATVDPRPPADATLVRTRELETGASVRRYEAADGPTYHLTPTALSLDRAALSTLDAAHDRLASGAVSGGDRAPSRAVRRVAAADAPVETLTRALRAYTQGWGVLGHLFADPAVTDVYVSAPADETPVRVVVDDEGVPTNVRLHPDGAATLASRFRQVSGRPLSRATPTLDAVVEANGTRIRVAGVTAPASDGLGFAFRGHDDDAWTLPRLVANGTLSAAAAGLLSVAAERGASGLVAGARGTGKTTLLGALLFELPAAARTVVVEDTPELPTGALRADGRDVQTLRTTTADGPALDPQEALHTALRMGEGPLVVGEVRGTEAQTLYEAMRVGATGGAVLGTIHGDRAADVRERVVSDLGVSPSSFAATDLVVTLSNAAKGRRVVAVEEVRGHGDDARFVPLFEADGASLSATGVVDRGESELVAGLTTPTETYADVRRDCSARADALERRAATGRVRPSEWGDGRAPPESPSEVGP